MTGKQLKSTAIKVDLGVTAALLLLTATRFRRERTVWTALPAVRGVILLAEIGHRLLEDQRSE
jgi:hypothetical protein